MFAIVQKTTEASGEKIYLLGMGNTELQARQAAYEYCNHPVHPWDEDGVFAGGHLMVVSDRLADLHRAAQWTGHYENGQQVGEDNTDAHGMLLMALGRLCVNAAGELDYTNLIVTPRPAPVLSPEVAAWDGVDDFVVDDYV
jgi:hypothetical protein